MRDLSPANCAQVTSRILALTRLGWSVAKIADELNHRQECVQRVLLGLDAFKRIDNSYLNECPTISDDAAEEIKAHSWPQDEAKTTEEIYAAAAAIREKRPRMPVGYQVFAVEMEATTFMGAERRGRSVA